MTKKMVTITLGQEDDTITLKANGVLDSRWHFANYKNKEQLILEAKAFAFDLCVEHSDVLGHEVLPQLHIPD